MSPIGCNCGKNKTAKVAAAQPQRPTNIVPARPKAEPIRIGPSKGQTQSFTLTFDSGRTQSFGSALEARAALARAGGRGSIA